MPYTLYVILLVILGVSIFISLIFLFKKTRIKLKIYIIPVIMVSLISTIVTDLSLKGSKLYSIEPDLSLKTTIVFSNQNCTLANGNSVEITSNGDSYIINNSEVDFYVEEVVYGVHVYEKIEDPMVETFSITKVPFRILSYFGTDDVPIESISGSRGTSGAVKYWLREANSTDSN